MNFLAWLLRTKRRGTPQLISKQLNRVCRVSQARLQAIKDDSLSIKREVTPYGLGGRKELVIITMPGTQINPRWQ